MPFFITLAVMANIGGAVTPISDPTTYYQAKTVGLGFAEVVMNSGVIVLVLSVVSLGYICLLFKNQLRAVDVPASSIALFNPSKAIKDRRLLWVGIPTLALIILLMVTKDYIRQFSGITLDNATLTLGGAFILMQLFHKQPKDIFRDAVDWEIIFFFMGLFIVVGSLEFTHIITVLAHHLVEMTHHNLIALMGLITVGSAGLLTFIDNVPYNITMVGAIQSMAKEGIHVYPLWWGLNLGTSIGGFGSLIAAACNVVAFSQIEREGFHIKFGTYFLYAFPLVMINAVVTFLILLLRFH